MRGSLPKGSMPIERATLVERGFFWISGRELFVRRPTICYQVSMEHLRTDKNLNFLKSLTVKPQTNKNNKKTSEHMMMEMTTSFRV